jgi:hypothetical protein
VAEGLRAVVDGRRLFPFDDGFASRARRLRRSQAPMLDAWLALCFEDPAPSGLSDERKAELYVLSWVLVTALDHAWTPP